MISQLRHAALVLLFVVGCSDGSAGENAGAGGGSTGTTTTTATTGVATTATGDPSCDAKGLGCGDSTDPGCQGCALDGACAESFAACGAEPHGDCLALNDCYAQCPAGEEACYIACDSQYPNGLVLLTQVVLCVFCGSCQESCNTDTSACPEAP